jgi:hypothetical protein
MKHTNLLALRERGATFVTNINMCRIYGTIHFSRIEIDLLLNTSPVSSKEFYSLTLSSVHVIKDLSHTRGTTKQKLLTFGYVRL